MYLNKKNQSIEILKKKRKDLVEKMKFRNDESKDVESLILQKGLEIQTVHAQNKNFTNVITFYKKKKRKNYCKNFRFFPSEKGYQSF